jgi:hypothetical protein
MGRKELSTLATRAKNAGNNKHDTKKERKKEHEIAGQKKLLVTTWSNNKTKRSSYDIAKFPLTNVLFAAVELHKATGDQEKCRVVYQKLSRATTKSRV